MPYYGDISGSLKGLISGDDELCVAAIVGGDVDDCCRCPKQTIRNVADIEEARWYNLLDTQKRRFVDCLRSNRKCLDAGYAKIRERDLQKLSGSYKIYQPDYIPEWPILFRSDIYFEILNSLTDTNSRDWFYPDRIHSPKQCELLEDELNEYLPQFNISTACSRQKKGIQTADCLAGSIRETEIGRTDWQPIIKKGFLSEDRSDWALNKLEYRLSEV